jgi:hypothetical protein
LADANEELHIAAGYSLSGRTVAALIEEGVKKCSVFNVQLSVVIDGGASRSLFSRMPRRRRIQN